jgi:hypothetical protein
MYERDKRMSMKWYVTEDGVNLYDLFSAGVAFGRSLPNATWTEQEWYDALEAMLPPAFVAKLDAQARERQAKSGKS